MSRKSKRKAARERRKKRDTGRRTLIIALIPALLLVGALAYIISIPPQPVQQGGNTHQGEEAPDFTLKVLTQNGLSGEEFSLSTARGSVVFMDFAFSWCPHCNRMAPTIKKLHDTYAERGVKFVTVMGNDARTDEQKSAEFLRKHDVSWTAVFDENLDVFNLYSVTGTPTYVVIGKDGRIVGRLVGEQSYDKLASLIEQALAS